MPHYNILVTLDANYILPLKVMLKSLFVNNPQCQLDVYMVYNNIATDELMDLEKYLQFHSSSLHSIYAGEDLFSEAPVLMHYTKAMYYRLLAYTLLPNSLTKILYLDPDILIINNIEGLYNINIENYMFAAASHTRLLPITDQVNKVRLKNYEADGYYNSGVLLMNLKKQREGIHPEDIYAYINKNKDNLFLPDQDVLNGLYWEHILAIDDALYNLDARKTETYKLVSVGKIDLNWILENTVILHFCGKQKPWKKSYTNRYAVLYKHYLSLTNRTAYGQVSK